MTTTPTQGLTALDDLFARTQAQGRAAFMPYWSIGYPTYDASLQAIEMLAAQGADAFEIGIPFSDPIADGPVVQLSTQKALENGVTVAKCLEAVKTLRARGVTQPMILMSYLNPPLAYGPERFVRDAKAAGADCLLFPDLPLEEGHLFAPACEEAGLGLAFFIAPTSRSERIAQVSAVARGFIYVAAQVGITGVRDALSDELPDFIARVRQITSTPLVLGFGISKPSHVQAMKTRVQGFAVGSALLRAVHDAPDTASGLADLDALAKSLVAALHE
jgi:tryptophan synthase alpha chain